MIFISYKAHSKLEIRRSGGFIARVKYIGKLRKLFPGLANSKKLFLFSWKGNVVFGAKCCHSLEGYTACCIVILNKTRRDWKTKLANIFIRSFESTYRRDHLNKFLSFRLRLGCSLYKVKNIIKIWVACSWKVFWDTLNRLESWLQLVHLF